MVPNYTLLDLLSLFIFTRKITVSECAKPFLDIYCVDGLSSRSGERGVGKEGFRERKGCLRGDESQQEPIRQGEIMWKKGPRVGGNGSSDVLEGGQR
jgi:hypothetical protein